MKVWPPVTRTNIWWRLPRSIWFGTLCSWLVVIQLSQNLLHYDLPRLVAAFVTVFFVGFSLAVEFLDFEQNIEEELAKSAPRREGFAAKHADHLNR